MQYREFTRRFSTVQPGIARWSVKRNGRKAERRRWCTFGVLGVLGLPIGKTAHDTLRAIRGVRIYDEPFGSAEKITINTHHDIFGETTTVRRGNHTRDVDPVFLKQAGIRPPRLGETRTFYVDFIHEVA